MTRKLCILFTILEILILAHGLPDLSFSTHSLYVAIGSSETFDLVLDQGLDQNATIKFWVLYPELARTDPSQLIILANTTVNEEITVYGLEAGHTLISANVSSTVSVDTTNAYIRVTSFHSNACEITSDVVGWVYFVAWSISFYPQVYENWRRKSVVGLNFDFLSLNLLGFFLYSLFNCGLYWIPLVREQYLQLHEKSAIPVKINDIFFSVHATCITLVTIFQCLIYERGGQRVSILARVIIGAFTLFLCISLLCSVFNVLQWLQFLYFCSYVKLTITLIKYVPQAFMNFRRKSTVGWSIGNVLLDFIGGMLSMLQMILDSYNYNDWSSIFGDPTKFGLGLFSVVFDILFVVQHYILYRNRAPYQHLSGYETIGGVDSPETETDVGKSDQSCSAIDAAPREFVT